MNEQYLTPAEVAARLRLTAYTVRKWIHSGALEAETIKQGRRNRYLIKKSTVEEIEQRSKHQHLV